MDQIRIFKDLQKNVLFVAFREEDFNMRRQKIPYSFLSFKLFHFYRSLGSSYSSILYRMQKKKLCTTSSVIWKENQTDVWDLSLLCCIVLKLVAYIRNWKFTLSLSHLGRNALKLRMERRSPGRWKSGRSACTSQPSFTFTRVILPEGEGWRSNDNLLPIQATCILASLFSLVRYLSAHGIPPLMFSNPVMASSHRAATTFESRSRTQ